MRVKSIVVVTAMRSRRCWLPQSARRGSNRRCGALRGGFLDQATIRRSGALFRDLIALIGPVLERECGMPNASSVLPAIFFPEALNLRNLLWHGFLVNCEQHLPEYCALLAVLQQELDTVCHTYCPAMPRGGHRLANLASCLDMTEAALEQMQRVAQRELAPAWADWSASRSLFPNASRRAILHFAVVRCYLEQRRYVSCLTLLIPFVLEHGLRLMFAEVNGLPQVCVANVAEFFTTLDGHGQHHKHHVILARELALGATSRHGGSRNALLEPARSGLQASMIALLQDVFCTLGGPQLRARVAHGMVHEELLRGDESAQREEARRYCDLVLVCIAALCGHTGARTVLEPYASNIHPLCRLRNAVLRAHGAWVLLLEQTERHRIWEALAERECVLVFPSHAEEEEEEEAAQVDLELRAKLTEDDRAARDGVRVLRAHLEARTPGAVSRAEWRCEPMLPFPVLRVAQGGGREEEGGRLELADASAVHSPLAWTRILDTVCACCATMTVKSQRSEAAARARTLRERQRSQLALSEWMCEEVLMDLFFCVALCVSWGLQGGTSAEGATKLLTRLQPLAASILADSSSVRREASLLVRRLGKDFGAPTAAQP